MSNRGPEEKISVCIICGNEIDNIERCLKSVTWADEILVLDSFSSDGTYEIAQKYTSKVFRHEWLGYIGQKKLIAEKASGPWILFVDADEEVSDNLRAEIETLFSKPIPEGVNGFNCPRLVHYLGRWIWHGDWYPDMKLRLFRKDCGYSGGQEPHDRVIVTGPVKTLKAPLHHFTYDDMSDHINTLNRFSTISAKQKAANGEPFRWRDLLFRPPWRFFKSYFLKSGFLSGKQGFIVAYISAFGVFLKYAKLMEIEQQRRAAEAQPPK